MNQQHKESIARILHVLIKPHKFKLFNLVIADNIVFVYLEDKVGNIIKTKVKNKIEISEVSEYGFSFFKIEDVEKLWSDIKKKIGIK